MLGVPGHPAKVGVTVIVPEMAAVVPLVAVKEGIFPVPDAPIPIAVFEFDQANVAPAGVLVKAVAGTVPPLQTVMAGGTVTVGIGLITTVTVEDDVQPPEVAITVYVPAAAAVTPVILGF